MGQNGQRERRDRHPPAFVLRHLFDSVHFSATTTPAQISGKSAEGRQHLRQHLCHRGTLGSHSFEDGACRATRRWRAVLAPKLAVRSVLEQPVRLGHSDKMERFIFTVMRKAELTSATWDTIWKMFLWSMDVMLGRSRLRKMEWCGLRPWRGKCWRKVGARCSRSPENNANDNMCWLCVASTGIQDLLYTGATQPRNSQDARVSGS